MFPIFVVPVWRKRHCRRRRPSACWYYLISVRLVYPTEFTETRPASVHHCQAGGVVVVVPPRARIVPSNLDVQVVSVVSSSCAGFCIIFSIDLALLDHSRILECFQPRPQQLISSLCWSSDLVLLVRMQQQPVESFVIGSASSLRVAACVVYFWLRWRSAERGSGANRCHCTMDAPISWSSI